MSSGTNGDFARVFGLLDRWRHLPAYQLERRADIFFAAFLPEILERALGVDIDPRIVPELPIKREDSHKSTKVDYFAMSQDRTRAFLIELKTEMRSRNETQDAYLVTAKQRGLPVLLGNIVAIASASNQKAKYLHLLKGLEELGLVGLPKGMEEYVFPTVRPGINEQLGRVHVPEATAAIEVVYIQPRKAGDDGVISFDAVAEILSTLDDPLARAFGSYLERWTEPAASRLNRSVG